MILIHFHVKIEVYNNIPLQKNGGNTVKMHLLESLYVELKNAIRCHYNELITRCRVDTIYGYSILTDDGVNSIGPVANKERLMLV